MYTTKLVYMVYNINIYLIINAMLYSGFGIIIMFLWFLVMEKYSMMFFMLLNSSEAQSIECRTSCNNCLLPQFKPFLRSLFD